MVTHLWSHFYVSDEFERWWKVEQAKAAEKRKAAGVIDLKSLREIKGAGTTDIHLEAADRTFVLQASTPVRPCAHFSLTFRSRSWSFRSTFGGLLGRQQEAEEWLKLMRQSAPTEEAVALEMHGATIHQFLSSRLTHL